MSGVPIADHPVRAVVARVGFTVVTSLVAAFFAVPMLWLISAPFDAQPGYALGVPSLTLDNFRALGDNPYVWSSLRNSVVLAVVTTALVLATGGLGAYALSRVDVPGRTIVLSGLLLFSAVVSGTAAMVPTFRLVFELGLINSRTGVVLVLAGGLLPAAIFILKDFIDGIPRSFEESAAVLGASGLQIVRDIIGPVIRPGLAVIGVWAVVQVWGDFLTPFILLRSASMSPAAVTMHSFYTEGGTPDLRLLSAFSLLYTLPVVALYLFVNRRYGFRFYGGIKS